MNLFSKKIMNTEARQYDAIEKIFRSNVRAIAVEERFAIRLNGKLFREIFCSPADVEDLALGVLAQAEAIRTVDDVARLAVADSLIEVETQAVTVPAQIESPIEVRFVAEDLLHCADKLLSALSATHGKTHGVHSGILFDGKDVLLFREDVGRHNVFDKIFGAALRGKLFLGDKCLLFSGRCSAEMLTKLKRMNVPVVVAKSVPTTLSIKLAKRIGITLVGRLTADSFCIYTNPERIVLK